MAASPDHDPRTVSRADSTAEDPREVPVGGELTEEAILAHAGFVRALARGLLRDDAEVDDVVQETLTRAIQHGPRRRAALASWLRTVVRNIAFKAHRGRARRESRERDAAQHEALPATGDLVVRDAALRDLTAAVLDLPEQAREAVMLRYFEGLSPQAIGARLGLPPGTVRMRLHRALVALRRRLDDESDGDRRQWMGGLALLAGLRPEPPAPAAQALWPSAQALVAVMGVAALAGLGVFLAAHPRGEHGQDLTVLAPRSPAIPDAAPPGRVERPAGSHAALRAEVGPGVPGALAAAPPEGGAPAEALPLVRGRVVDATGAPVAGATVLGAWASSELVERGRTGADGRFALARDDSPTAHGGDQPFLLAATAAGHAPSAVGVFPHREGVLQAPAELVLRGPGAALAVEVVDAAGAPLAGARVAVGERLRFGLGLLGPMQADEENPLAPMLAVRATGRDRATFPGVPALRGSLGAMVAERGRGVSRQIPARVARTGPDGTATFAGLEPGNTRVHVSAPGSAATSAFVDLGTHDRGRAALRVALARGARLRGKVERSDGLALQRVLVHAVASDGATVRSVYADGLGEFSVDGLTAGTVRLVAQEDGPDGARGEVSVTTRAGATVGVELALAPTARRELHLSCASAALAGWRVEVRARGNPVSLLERVFTDADGRARLATAYVVPADVWVLPGDRACTLPHHVEPLPDAAAGSAPRALTLEPGALTSATVAGRLLLPGGGPAPAGTWLQLSGTGAGALGLLGLPGQVLDDSGRFELGPLPRGRYRLTAPYVGLGVSREALVEVAGDGRVELGDVRLPDLATLELAVPSGGWVELSVANEFEDGGARYVLFEGRAEDGATLELGPGRYSVMVAHGAPRRIALTPGARLRVEAPR